MSAQSLARALSTIQRFMYGNSEPPQKYVDWELKILYKVR